MVSKVALALSLTLLVGAWAHPVAAQQDDPALRSAGRKLAQDGVALFQQGKAAEASQKLEKAYQILQVPSVALWSARALERRGLLVEASERYVEASRLTGFKGDKDVQLQAQQDAARELERLQPRIPNLVVAIAPSQGEPVQVTLDGKQVPAALLGEEQPVNPGSHEIQVTRGKTQIVRRVTLKESEKKTESIDLNAPAPPSEPASAAVAVPVASPETTVPASDAPASKGNPRRTLAFVALAAGGVGLVVGGVTGGLALGKRSSLEKSGCNADADTCPPSQRNEAESLDTLRTVSSVGFIAGGVLAATGVVLLLTSKQETSARSSAPRLALHFSPRAIQLSGSFQ